MSESQTMALVAPPPNDRRRVKVYELRKNDWFDRGTGFCMGQVVDDQPKIIVVSEEQPDRKLLEATIEKDVYQKQQDTLIVWTAAGNVEMALSFQEADGCSAIWDFVAETQQHLLPLATPDDALSDDAVDVFSRPIMPPTPDLGNLAEIDQVIRNASSIQEGREQLTKYILEQDYLAKLVPLVDMAEDLEDLSGLHRLSNIMKMLILLNDTQIIEHMVSDSIILGLVGALEYDHEFPHHKANHRQYLQNKSRFKEVVPIEDQDITRKIHATWRLQYLKDVVLARMLDDPTFGVLNSLIFFNQVEIVQHLQSNAIFLKELFRLIDGANVPATKRKDAVCFLQQCCAIAKNLQAQARGALYSNLIANGLLSAIVFALAQPDAPVRTAGTDILVAMIDHDPALIRQYIFRSIADKQRPLTDVLIDLLLKENDLGVKAQAADAIKILLDPQSIPSEGQRVGDQFMNKFRGKVQVNQETESFIQDFYENGAKKLFQPLKNLEHRESLRGLTFQEVSLYSHLVEILMYFVRNHLYRSKFFISSENITARVGQLLGSSHKHMKLTALKFFRTCLALQDEFYYTQIIQTHIFSHIIDIVEDTMPRDNLLNSACLEVFEYIKRETTKSILYHVVQNYRSRLEALTYVPVFEQFINRYDICQGFGDDSDRTLFSNDDESNLIRNRINGANERWQGVRDLDPDEEHYFNTPDEEDDDFSTKPRMIGPLTNGTSPLTKPLVDYPEDEDEEEEGNDSKYGSFYARPFEDGAGDEGAKGELDHNSPDAPTLTPPERLAEKRRREEDEEDELGKLSVTKRRNSSSSTSSIGSTNSSPGSQTLRRKKSLIPTKESPGGSKKMTISLSMKTRNGNEAAKDRNHNEEQE